MGRSSIGMIDGSAARGAGRTAEIVTACPDCGQILVRPEDFSGDRMLYLHRKWSGCTSAEIDLRDGGAEGADDTRVEILSEGFPTMTPGY